MSEEQKEYQQASSMVNPNGNHVFSGLDKSRKVALAVLAGFAVIVFVYGAYSLRKGIYAPFSPATKSAATPSQSGGSDVSKYCPSGNCADLTDDQLRAKDTDHDGLSDYDELNLHKTSPYLEDSDSDGFLDKEEIDNNKDPNCPTGRECAKSVLANGEADLTNPGVANNIDLEELEALNKKQQEAANAGSASAADLSSLDAATLRQMLLEAGMEKAQLDQLSDEMLMQTFKETLSEQNKDNGN